MRKGCLSILLIVAACHLYAQKQYNVVWLVAEDQSAQFFPMYGDTTIQLPALQSLAEESIIYDNAFATVPVCAPARSSIILGMHPIKIGTHNMRTYKANKAENEPSINVPSYTPVMPPGTIEFPKYLRAEGYYCTNNSKEDYNMKITEGTWDESSSKATWENRSQDQPFFSIFNYNDCHESGIWKFGEDSLFVDPDLVSVPPYFPDDSVIRHDLAVNYSNLKRIDDKISKIIYKLKSQGLYDNTFIFFYADHGGPLPRHKRSLRDTGLKVPLFVKLPKDLSQGMSRSDEMISFIDLAPTILSIAGIQKPENMQGKAFLGQYQGEKSEYIFASSDRYDAVYEKSRAIRSQRFKYIRNYRPDLPYAIPVAYREQVPMMKRLRQMAESNELKGPSLLWMRENKEEEELFDVITDPFELNNLANNPFYFSELERHRKALDVWIENDEDQGRMEEQELIKKWRKVKDLNTLKPPIVENNGSKIKIFNPNLHGHLLYRKKGEQVWHPWKEGAAVESKMIFKVVHIGLEDSEPLTVNTE